MDIWPSSSTMLHSCLKWLICSNFSPGRILWSVRKKLQRKEHGLGKDLAQPKLNHGAIIVYSHPYIMNTEESAGPPFFLRRNFKAQIFCANISVSCIRWDLQTHVHHNSGLSSWPKPSWDEVPHQVLQLRCLAWLLVAHIRSCNFLILIGILLIQLFDFYTFLLKWQQPIPMKWSKMS